MRISAKAIVNFANINQLNFGNQWTIRAGDPNTLYFQIVDLDQNGLRYMVGSGVQNQPASVVVTFPSIDDTQVINSTAIQETDDKSIFKVVLGPNQIPNSGSVRFMVQEGSTVRRFSVLNLISVEHPENEGSC